MDLVRIRKVIITIELCFLFIKKQLSLSLSFFSGLKYLAHNTIPQNEQKVIKQLDVSNEEEQISVIKKLLSLKKEY
jgi:hypothetical protein